MNNEQLQRIATERSSVAQDERGLTPEERELWQTAWVEGFKIACSVPRDAAPVGTVIEWNPDDGYGTRIGIVTRHAQWYEGEGQEGAQVMLCTRINGPREGKEFSCPVQSPDWHISVNNHHDAG